jgi:hypothetical protein
MPHRTSVIYAPFAAYLSVRRTSAEPAWCRSARVGTWDGRVKIVRVAEWTVDFGGEAHAGWLPEGAAKPAPTRVTRADLALSVLEHGPGDFTLEWRGPTEDTSGDTSHSSVEEALSAAKEAFGVPEDAWAKLDDAARQG